jgi:hypothetical protein
MRRDGLFIQGLKQMVRYFQSRNVQIEQNQPDC